MRCVVSKCAYYLYSGVHCIFMYVDSLRITETYPWNPPLLQVLHFLCEKLLQFPLIQQITGKMEKNTKITHKNSENHPLLFGLFPGLTLFFWYNFQDSKKICRCIKECVRVYLQFFVPCEKRGNGIYVFCLNQIYVVSRIICPLTSLRWNLLVFDSRHVF